MVPVYLYIYIYIYKCSFSCFFHYGLLEPGLSSQGHDASVPTLFIVPV